MTAILKISYGLQERKKEDQNLYDGEFESYLMTYKEMDKSQK